MKGVALPRNPASLCILLKPQDGGEPLYQRPPGSAI